MAQQGLHKEEIKAALVKRFGPITALSRAWGWDPTAISVALTGTKLRAPVAKRIADALGETPHTLWPDRWNPDGSPRTRRVINREIATSGVPAHPEKKKAA
ncbi:helix-turn-helix domain-containing protein [Humitalea sp. 24SJ18S-53]|uniref:helix-turn-helix domain-containing protein n=1 Tax=Humitalea sp. 24SJ18S-53 TaxID=3422307 RepID=UPI003D66DCA7